jgi:glycosyltransferase involved in cell wall biosynthesis/thymidylate kinase
MRILYVTAELPWPLSSGYLRHFHFLRALGTRHDVTLLSLTGRGPVSPQTAAALAPHVRRLRVFGADPVAAGAAARAAQLRRAARRLASAVQEELDATRYDVVLLSGKDTMPALRAVRVAPLVVDVCDAASLRLRGELAVAPARRRPVVAARLAQMRGIERRLAQRTPRLLFASERDRDAVLRHRAGGAVVPNGVDIEHWSRTSPPAQAPRIVFSGVMGYRPNHDAAMRLAERVLPRVRAVVGDAELVLAGRDPRPSLLEAAHRVPGVVVTGALADLRPDLEAAAVYCAPLRFAAGIQNKLLEAMALELPVVTTPVAAAGLRIGGDDGPVEVAADDDGLADALIRLLGDPVERARLGAAGRRHVERHSSWERSAALLEAELERAARAPRQGFSVALIGCDGAGKTTVARELAGDPALGLRYLYMGVSPDSSNRQLPTTRLIHAVKRTRGAPPDTHGPRPPGRPPPLPPLRRARRGARAGLRLANRLAEEWYRQLLAGAYQRRGEVVLFDRHFVADFHAADITDAERTLSRRLHGLVLARAYPKPDLTIFLDARPEVLYARKGEGTIESLARRRIEYLQLRDSLPGYAVVSAERPLAEVVDEVRTLIGAYEPGT